MNDHTAVSGSRRSWGRRHAGLVAGLVLVALGVLMAACQPTPMRTLVAAWATFTATPSPVTAAPTWPSATPLPPPYPTPPPSVGVPAPTWPPPTPMGYPPSPTAIWYPPTPTPVWYPPQPTPWVYPPTPTPVWYLPQPTPWVYPPTPTPLWYSPQPTPWVYPPAPTPLWYPPIPTPIWYPPATSVWYPTPTLIAYPATWTPQPPPATPLPPVVTLGVTPPTTQLLVGQSVALNADAVGQGLSFRWTVARGILSAYNTPAVIYTAPAFPGPDTITVAVSNLGGTMFRSVSFTIVTPTPAVPTPVPPTPIIPTPFVPTATPVVSVVTLTPTPGNATPTTAAALGPAETLSLFYRAVDARDYITAWSMLSPEFKYAWHCCTPAGDLDYANFVRWWDRVTQVTLQDVGLISPVGDDALVYADVVYQMPDGTEIADPYAYTYLVRESMTGTWQLAARGPSAEIADAPPPPAPDLALRNYYDAASRHLYNTSWPMLSSHFKTVVHCCTDEGDYDFAGYAAWWDTVQRVEISSVRLVEQTDSTATVYADLAYLKQDGEWVLDPQSVFRMVLDPKIRAWLIDAKETADQPLTTPQPVGGPIEAVRRYYAATNEHNYAVSWAMLSPHFKQKWNCCAPDGGFDLAGYTAWWDSVRRVDIGHVELVDQNETRATVFAELAYLLRDGRQVLDTGPYIQLVFDSATGEWSFWDKGETP